MSITIPAGGSCAFAAQIRNTITDSCLNADDVSAIEYTIYKSVLQLNSETLTEVTGHVSVSVSLTAILEQPVTADFWTVDTTGYNMLHQPDSTTNKAFPASGTYRVIYTITLTSGNPIVISYDVTAT